MKKNRRDRSGRGRGEAKASRQPRQPRQQSRTRRLQLRQRQSQTRSPRSPQSRQQQQQKQQGQRMRLAVRSFLRHSVSGICRSRIIGTTAAGRLLLLEVAGAAPTSNVDGDAAASSDGRTIRDGRSGDNGSSGSCSSCSSSSSSSSEGGGEKGSEFDCENENENENEIPSPSAAPAGRGAAAGADLATAAAAAAGAAAGFRPASFGDVPGHLLHVPAPPAAAMSGGCRPGTAGGAAACGKGDIDVDDDGSADDEGADLADVASELWDWLEGRPQRRHQQQNHRHGGNSSLGEQDEDSAGLGGMLDHLSGAVCTNMYGRAATLVVATWVREDEEEEEEEEEDRKDDKEKEREERPADGTILERFRFSLLPRSAQSLSSQSSSSSASAASASVPASTSASATTHYFGQLRCTLRSLQEYCDGAEARGIVDPGEDMDYEAIERGFTMVLEEEVVEEEGVGEGEVVGNYMDVGKGGHDDGGGGGLFANAGGLDPLDARQARTVLRRRRREANGDAAMDGLSCQEEEVGGALMTDSTDTDTTNASDLGLGGTTMMMAQQSQSQTSNGFTERTERTDRDEIQSGHAQSQSRSQLTDDGDEGHTQTQYSDEIEDGDEDDESDDEGGRMVRYHLGSIDLGDCQLSVSVERSIYAPESPVIRLLFGGDDDCSDDDSSMEDESLTQSRYGGDLFSVSTALPSQGTMGFSSYRRMEPTNARPTHDVDLGGLDDASNGSMVTPPPPMSTVQVRAKSYAHQSDLDASIASTQPSQGTDLGTHQSSITEGASQRSRRRKGPKKKQSARARANADVSKIMGVRRRDCIPKTRKSRSPPALTPMPPAGSAARSTGKRPALASALRNGSGGGGKRRALSNTANRSTRFSPLPKVGNGGGNTPMRRGVGPSSRSPAISSTSTVLVGSANTTPVPRGGASGRSPAISGASTATVLMSRYGSVGEAETVFMSRTPTPPRSEIGRQK